MVSLSSFLPPSLGWGKSTEEMRQDRREELQKRRQQRAKVDASPKNAIPPAKKSNENRDTAKMMKRMSRSASSSFRKGGILKMW